MARAMGEMLPEAVGIFILPPSLAALQSRLTGRGQDSAEVIARRLLESKTQIPHFYVEIEIDAAPLTTLREQLNAAMASGQELDENTKALIEEARKNGIEIIADPMVNPAAG